MSYYLYKLYYLAKVDQTGSLPLWSPSEGGGFPLYSNPLVAPFYPLNLLLLGSYKLLHGMALVDLQRFTLLGIVIFALGVYAWLRSLSFSTTAAMVAAITVAISFRIADLLRFPNALHALAWYPWILFAITKLFEAGTVRKKFGYAALLSSCWIMLLTAGYPYNIYYVQFLLLPYLLFLAVPTLRTKLFTSLGVTTPLQSIALGAAAVMGATLLCLPYLLKIQQLLRATVNRGGGDYAFALEGQLNWSAALGAFIFPPASDPDGWSFFGVTALLLIGWFAVRLFQEKRWLPLLSIGGWLLFLTCITLGEQTPLFRLLWEHYPLFSQLRFWGRLHCVSLLLFAWCLAAAFDRFVEELPVERHRSAMLKIIAGLYGAIATLQLLFFLYPQQFQHPNFGIYFYRFETHTWWFLALGAIGLFGVLGLIRMGSALSARAAGIALVALTCIELFPMGAPMWRRQSPTPYAQRLAPDIRQADLKSFGTPRDFEPSLVRMDAHFGVQRAANWYYARFERFVLAHPSTDPALRRLLGVDGGEKLFFTSALTHNSIADYLYDHDTQAAQIDVDDYNGDRLQLRVTARQAGYLGFIDNWDPDWRATIDGQPTPVVLLMDSFKSVSVPAGAHRVTFEYCPFNGRNRACAP